MPNFYSFFPDFLEIKPYFLNYIFDKLHTIYINFEWMCKNYFGFVSGKLK